MTRDIRQLLAAIQDPHAEKKRRTVILLAFAKANQQPVKAVFDRPDACSEAIWYGDGRRYHDGTIKPGWRDLPDVAAAFEACTRRALDFADEQTVDLEAHYTRQRRQAISRHSAVAPDTLASIMQSEDIGAGTRINAALALIKLAQGDANVPLPPGNTEFTLHQQYDLSRLSDDELTALDTLADRFNRSPSGADPAVEDQPA